MGILPLPFLLSVDQDLAETTGKANCPCGGRLHCADYPRKPCGAVGLPDQYRTRLSFCWRDGCRKRRRPRSVRFLGRKVYLGAVVVLVAAMRQGPTPRACMSCASISAATGGPLAAGERSGKSSSPRLSSAKSREVASVQPSTWPPHFHERSWRSSCATPNPARSGESCCAFSHRSRSPGG